MIELLQILLDGFMTGTVYAALALALSVVFQGTRMLNLAQGELATLAAFIAYTVMTAGMPAVISGLVAIVLSAIIGALVYLLVVRFVDAAQQQTLMTMGVALLLGLNAITSIVWGTDPRNFPSPFGNGVVTFAGLRLTSQQIGAALSVAAVMAVIALIFTRTSVGLRMRAVAENRASAALLGLSATIWIAAGWAAACAVGAVAGIVAAPTLGLSPSMLAVSLLMALAATNLGGIFSSVGVVVGGLLIGILTAVGGRYVPLLGGDLNVILAFGVAIVVVLIKPEGLFGRKSTVRA